MKILFITNHSEGTAHEQLASITVPIMREYCEIHGYGLAVMKCDYARENHVQALRLIMEQLAEHDIVVTIGADVLITNYRVCVENFLESPLTLAQENLRWWPINNDVCIWRQSEVTYRLLQRLIDDAETWLAYPWLWQNHIWNLIQTEPWIENAVRIVPARMMNSTHQPGLSQWQLGDWIIHFLDMPIEEKIRLAKQYLPFVGDGTFIPPKPQS